MSFSKSDNDLDSELDQTRNEKVTRADSLPKKIASIGNKLAKRSKTIGDLTASSRYEFRSDTQLSPTQPSKDFSSATSMSNNPRSGHEKFIRHFPDVTDDLVKSYHCALILDDIKLFQGVLYVTQSSFCFYSKIGRKTLKIPVSSITRIAKLNTALIIPNAVGIYTENDKYVFGSLLKRKNTFRFLTKIWEETTSNTLSANTTARKNNNNNVSMVTNHNNSNATGRHSRHPSDATNISHTTTSGSSEASYSGDPGSSPGRTERVINGDDDDEDDESISPQFADDSLTGRRSPPSVAFATSSDSTATSSARKRQHGSHQSADAGNDVNNSIKDKSIVQNDALSKRTIKFMNYELQTTSGFLSIMTAIVVLLLLCAVFMSFKLVRLQAQQEAFSTVYASGRDIKVADTLSGEETYRLRHERHCAIIDKLNAVTKEHVQMLDKVKQSLEELSHASEKSRYSSLVDDLFDTEIKS